MKKKHYVQVALAGRRNVGKSTLFNALLGKRRAITDSIPGLTRDILQAEIHRGPYHFILSDTPGLDIEHPDQLETAILDRARKHIEQMDLVILLLESPGPDTFDHFYIDFLRKSAGHRPVLFVVNKVDGATHVEEGLSAFYEAGVPDPIPVSARGRWNLDTLLERMAQLAPGIHRPDEEQIPEEKRHKRRKAGSRKKSTAKEDLPPEEDELEWIDDEEEEGEGARISAGEDSEEGQEPGEEGEEGEERKRDDSTIVSDDTVTDTRIAIVGRPNSGKSSLLNRLVSKEVSLVSDIPGTTRDTVDTVFQYYGKSIRIIDTAGMRRVQRLRGVTKDIEFYSISRTRRAVKDSRIVVHLIDATQGITDFDKKIASFVQEYRKPMIIAVNKWDAIPDKTQKTMEEYLDRLRFLFPHAARFPTIFCSAKTGQRIQKILDIALELDQKMKFRIPTSKLNSLVVQWNRDLRGQAARILYATQADTEPPVFVFFVKESKGLRKNVVSFFENQIRKGFDLEGIPIRILIREREHGRD